MSDFDVKLINNSMQEFFVKFKGPQDSEFHIAPVYWNATNMY
jgi:hypothetical protein